MKNITVLRFFLTIFCVICANLCLGQVHWSIANLNELRGMDDSICQFGKKYDYPKRLFLDSLVVPVSEDYKIQEINRAVPRPCEEDTTQENIDELYFYELMSFDGLSRTEDRDTIDYRLPSIEEFKRYSEYEKYCFDYPYTLRDIYFFDVNGDGKLDFLQYPLFYNFFKFDTHFFYLFIQTENGYKRLRFNGFIVDIDFNEDGTLNEIKTFQPECCLDGRTAFLYYVFDKEKNELTFVKSEEIQICQFNGEEPFSEF